MTLIWGGRVGMDTYRLVVDGNHLIVEKLSKDSLGSPQWEDEEWSEELDYPYQDAILVAALLDLKGQAKP